jgi:uncharacterized protein YdcH (DUF465 family)
MSHVPHDLHEEFPDAVPLMHELKQRDQHFARLAARYHEVNREIHRFESGVEPTSDQTLEDAKKARLVLKDDIAAMLASHTAR